MYVLSFPQALDRVIWYLRLVHSVDFYNAMSFPSEDCMPHRCGIFTVRPQKPNAVTQDEGIACMYMYHSLLKYLNSQSTCMIVQVYRFRAVWAKVLRGWNDIYNGCAMCQAMFAAVVCCGDTLCCPSCGSKLIVHMLSRQLKGIHALSAIASYPA